MTMALAEFQSGLARALRGEDTCPVKRDSPGFRFTVMVWRSWCELRTIAAARAVFGLVPAHERRRLVTDYVERGGGLAAFLPTESETLLPFLAERLADPSHALTICRMDMALARARAGVATFAPRKTSSAQDRVKRGPHAALVCLHADPGTVLSALSGGPLSPVGAPEYPVFFAPGLPTLFRTATAEEAAFWVRLPSTDAPHGLVRRLLAEGVVAIAS